MTTRHADGMINMWQIYCEKNRFYVIQSEGQGSEVGQAFESL